MSRSMPAPVYLGESSTTSAHYDRTECKEHFLTAQYAGIRLKSRSYMHPWLRHSSFNPLLALMSPSKHADKRKGPCIMMCIRLIVLRYSTSAFISEDFRQHTSMQSCCMQSC